VRLPLIIFRIWLVRVGFAVGSLLPLRRHVVLASNHGARISGNLEAVRIEMARRSPKLGVTVLAHRPGRGVMAMIIAAFHAMRSGYHLARARVFVVDDYYFPIYVVSPRGGTTIVQTWHASGAFKKLGYSVVHKTFGADPALLHRVRIHSNYDLCLVSNERAAAHYAEAFGLSLQKFTWRLGIPRTDPFFDPAWRNDAAAAVRRRYDLPADKRVLLYAPTFRGERVTEARHTEDLDFGQLQAVLGEDHVVLVRLHPFVRSRMRLAPELAGFAVDVSDHPDIHELMLVSDLLITDYSSAIFEFSLLERPMAFLAPDLDAYERERGFYFDYRAGVPGPVFTETGALARWLSLGAFDLDRVRAFRDASFAIADGRASRRFVDQIVLPALRSTVS